MKNRDPRDHDQQQIRDMHLVFEHVKQGLMTEMAARPLMMEIVTRPIRSIEMTERELIRGVRAELVRACICDEVRVDRNSEVCGYCVLTGMIDKGLAEIGEMKNGQQAQRPV